MRSRADGGRSLTKESQPWQTAEVGQRPETPHAESRPSGRVHRVSHFVRQVQLLQGIGLKAWEEVAAAPVKAAVTNRTRRTLFMVATPFRGRAEKRFTPWAVHAASLPALALRLRRPASWSPTLGQKPPLLDLGDVCPYTSLGAHRLDQAPKEAV